MEYLIWAPVAIVGLLVVLWALIAAAGAAAIHGIQIAKLVELPDEKSQRTLSKVLVSGMVTQEWAQETGFRPIGAFRVEGMQGTPRMVSWALKDQRTYLNVYVLPNDATAFDFVTMLDNGGSLSTGISADAHTVPQPTGSWMQTFDCFSTAELWRHHKAGLLSIRNTYGIKPAPGGPSLASDFAHAMRQSAAYVSSLPLWQLRIPYWYFVRRATLHNKPSV